MDEGRIAGTPEIWDATQLSRLDDAFDVLWECPGCTLPVYPAAWRSNEHKVTAHFKKRPRTDHHHRCKYDLLCKSGPRSLTDRQMGRPGSWVDTITFPEARPFRADPVARATRNRGAPDLVEHSSTRHSINAACQFHHVTAGSRMDWPLTVEGVTGGNYFDVFAPACFPPSADPESKIWFGELHVTSALHVVGTEITITLNEYVRDAIPSVRAVVVVDLDGWSTDQRRLFRDRLEEVRAASKWTKGRRPRAPIIYALGPRRPGAPEIIRLNHPRRFAIVTRP